MSSLQGADLENHSAALLPFAEGSALGLPQAIEALRRMLREDFWCRLEVEGAFLHVGYDYYMYVGVPSPCPRAEALALRLGPIRRGVLVAVPQGMERRTRAYSGTGRRKVIEGSRSPSRPVR